MRIRLKIVGTTTATIFTLSTAFVATYSWFSLNDSSSVTGAQVRVKVFGTASMTSLNLIKFDYSYDTIGNMQVYDYLNPEDGDVNEYYFNEEYNGGAGSFGYDDNGNFVPINALMNIYDPVDRIIRGGDLNGLNCNAIYEATFSSTMDESYLQLCVDRLLDKLPEEGQILLSSCVDFDVFYENDLAFEKDTYSDSSTYSVDSFVTYNGFIYKCKTAVESSESFDSLKWDQVPCYSTSSTYDVNACVIYNGAIYKCITAVNTAESFSKAKWQLVETYSTSSTYAFDALIIHKGHPYKCITAINSGESFNSTKWKAILCERIYYPSYKTSGFSSLEDKYYRISYISSLQTSHINFYSTNPKPNSVALDRNHLIDFASSGGEAKVYINVNYAPSQADVYIREIYNTIRAIYDFSFDFYFTESQEALI